MTIVYRETAEADTAEVTVHRVVDFDMGGGDGRTLHTRIVPWDTPATVADPPDFIPYQEMWAKDAFDKQLNAANRVNVLMNFEHEKGIGGVVGRGVELRKENDGLHGVFRMLTSQDADKALELVHEEILTGLSLEASVRRVSRTADIVVRQDARLVNVALCRNPAYAEARVLAVRQEAEEEPPAVREQIVIPPPLDVERLQKLGMTIPRLAPSDDDE